MTEKEKCFEKITFFNEKGADKALRFQPDKKKYKCRVCNHWHLSTGDATFNRDKIASYMASRGSRTTKGGVNHFIGKYGEKVFYVTNKYKKGNHVVDKVVEITNKNQLPKFLWRKYEGVKTSSLKSFNHI